MPSTDCFQDNVEGMLLPSHKYDIPCVPKSCSNAVQHSTWSSEVLTHERYFTVNTNYVIQYYIRCCAAARSLTYMEV